MDLINIISFSGHDFCAIENAIKEKYGLINSDKICNKCGIVVNSKFFIVNTKNGNVFDPLVYIENYELNCNEIMIKRLLE